jgi:hypothetical protein
MPNDNRNKTEIENFIKDFMTNQKALDNAKTPEERQKIDARFQMYIKGQYDEPVLRQGYQAIDAMRESKADGGFPDLNKDGKTSFADVLMGRGVDLEREDKAMGGTSLMMPPEREQFMSGALAKVVKAVFKPKTKQGKNLSKRLQETYEPEELEEAIKELVAVVEANTQVNKKGKADLKITKSNLVTETSNNLASKDVFMTTNALEDILKLDNIREGSGGKTDNLYDSIIQLAASKLEEPSLMGQFVGDIAGVATRGDRATALTTGLKTAGVAGTAGALLSNLDRLPQSVQNVYADLNPTEKERLDKEFGEAFKQGLDEFIFIDDEGNKRPIAVKLAADDNPDVVFERVEKNMGAIIKALGKKLGKKSEPEGFKKFKSEFAEDTVEEAQDKKFFADVEEKEKEMLIAQFAKQIGGYSRKDILKLQKEDDKDQVLFDLIDELADMGRDTKGHGGSSGVAILMPAEYEEPPKDTYNNVSTEEEKEQVENMDSDGEMEEEYLDYVADEVLSQEEQDYLFKALDEDNKLEEILDKVMLNATEFTGSGEVDGPGTGVSDSVPARLSDGEFVFTRKATDQIGADKLQKMMDDAEREFDQRKGKANGGEAGTSPFVNPEEMSNPLNRFGMDKDNERDIERQMLYSSRMPSLMNR